MAYTRLLPRLIFRFVLYTLLAYCIIAGVYLFLDWQGLVPVAADRPEPKSNEFSQADLCKESPLMPVPNDAPPSVYEVFQQDKDDNPPTKLTELQEPVLHAKKLRDLNSRLQEQDSVIQDLNRKLQFMHHEKSDLVQKVDDLKKMQHSSQERKETPFSRLMHSDTLPPSSAYCHGKTRDDRHCRFQNLCYNPKVDSWFVVKSNRTVFLNVPEDRSDGFMDMTSLQNHGVFFWNFAEVPERFIQNQMVEVVQERTYILMRFHTGNIMHAMHDDYLGLYFHLKMYSPTGVGDKYSDEGYVPFARDHNILFIEGSDQGGYGHIFQALTDRPLQFKSRLDKEKITCFMDAVVGQSKQANWYQYGFGEVQGPIANKKVNGLNIREAANYMMKQLGIPGWDRQQQKEALRYLRVSVEHNAKLQHLKLLRELEPLPMAYKPLAPPKDANIAIFSRRHDRLLKNEEELARLLEEAFQIPVKFVRNEDLGYKQQIEILRNSVLSIGMHGSLLVMGMFQPPGSMMVELYPYAVPGDNYSPYKTMCHLPGMELTYRNWMNKHPENNIPHPEYPQYHGGLMDFPEEQRQKILNTLTVPSHFCCSDPYWLFRIYQDTIAHPQEVLELITDAIMEAESAYQLAPAVPETVKRIVPAAVGDKVRCMTMPPSHGDILRDVSIPKIVVEWDKPWNVDSVVQYGVWVHQTFKELIQTETHVELNDVCATNPNEDIDIWVRAYHNNGTSLVAGPWSKKVTCSCTK